MQVIETSADGLKREFTITIPARDLEHEIIRRLDNIKLAIPLEEITYLPTLATQTVERLPLTFTRRV